LYSSGTSTVNIAYNYSSNQNNGKITSQYDYVSGETVAYTYDTLNRLATAGTSAWGQSYAYDGFGNLTDITSTLGTTPEWHMAYSAATNRGSGECADANGNLCGTGLGYIYDVENRLLANGSNGLATAQYAYAPDNKRVWRGEWSGGSRTVNEAAFWSVTGQRVGFYNLVSYGGSLKPVQTGTEYYFGGKLVKNAGAYVHADRLGSIGKYYPYGQERPSATQNGTEKFATYFRDADTGLDYADQRYHAPGQGRFLSPDPSMYNVDLRNPGTWDAYAYTNGDPINSTDPEGLDTCGDLTITGGMFSGQTVSQVMTGTTANDNLAELIWHEDGTLSPNNSNSTDMIAIGTAVMNQLAVDDGQMTVYAGGTKACPLGQCLNRNLSQIIYLLATELIQGQLVHVFDNSGNMVDGQQTVLKGILNTDTTAGKQVLDPTGVLINSNCEGILDSLNAANDVLGGTREVGPNGLALLFWNQQSPTTPLYPGYVGVKSPGVHTFWGLYTTPTHPPTGVPPVRKPPSRPR
jgi:RHS repeat-associated protein